MCAYVTRAFQHAKVLENIYRVLELSCKANAIELARIAEPQPIMSKKSTRYVGAHSHISTLAY